MKKITLIIPVVAVLLSGCSGMNTTQQRTLSGGAIGAAAGAGITAIAGANPIWGAVGGAAVGAVSGYVYDQYEKSKANHNNSNNQKTKPAATTTKPAATTN